MTEKRKKTGSEDGQASKKMKTSTLFADMEDESDEDDDDFDMDGEFPSPPPFTIKHFYTRHTVSSSDVVIK